mmetsp:Transcript_76763/g.152198  ORF Transcript_76763/g.152198 Transcript_76763/m.152198 type:complete len:282 (+) Transcript_76763:93-938(+)
MLDFLRDLSVNGGKTFRPTSGHRPGTRTFALHERYKKTLGTDNLRMAAALPNGEDANEWVAMKVVDMFNEVELVQGMVSEFCTSACCSVMSAGPKYEYLWADSQRYPKPTKVSAPEYIGLLFQWVKAQLDDEKVFPTQIGAPFPPDFRERVHNICKRLFRVYAHIFYCHFERVVELSFEAHLNSCFKHFMYFILEFDLVRAEELRPLQPLMDRCTAKAVLTPKHSCTLTLTPPSPSPTFAPSLSPTPILTSHPLPSQLPSSSPSSSCEQESPRSRTPTPLT